MTNCGKRGHFPAPEGQPCQKCTYCAKGHAWTEHGKISGGRKRCNKCELDKQRERRKGGSPKPYRKFKSATKQASRMIQDFPTYNKYRRQQSVGPDMALIWWSYERANYESNVQYDVTEKFFDNRRSAE